MGLVGINSRLVDLTMGSVGLDLEQDLRLAGLNSGLVGLCHGM